MHMNILQTIKRNIVDFYFSTTDSENQTNRDLWRTDQKLVYSSYSSSYIIIISLTLLPLYSP